MKVVKDYNIWSNFVYFIAGIYAFLIGIYDHKVDDFYRFIFSIFGTLIIVNGIVSCIYHTETPSYTNDIDQYENERYQKVGNIDQGISITSLVYALLFFLARFFTTDKTKILKDPMLWFTLMFGAVSIVFFEIAKNHNNTLETCNKEKCINDNMNSYDIFHSNWHIFTGVSMLFGITVIYNTFTNGL